MKDENNNEEKKVWEKKKVKINFNKKIIMKFFIFINKDNFYI